MLAGWQVGALERVNMAKRSCACAFYGGAQGGADAVDLGLGHDAGKGEGQGGAGDDDVKRAFEHGAIHQSQAGN